MRKIILLVLSMGWAGLAWGNEVTFNFVNLNNTTFFATASQLTFFGAANTTVTDNTNGMTIALSAFDSGATGAATNFVPGPPLVVDYNGSGANSVLIKSGSHVYLSGSMDDEGRLEAQYPNDAGAFLSRFSVSFVDPAVLASLGLSPNFSPEGSVSLTLAETAFDGTTLNAVLGGGAITIETPSVAPVPEMATLLLMGTGMVMIVGMRKRLV